MAMMSASSDGSKADNIVSEDLMLARKIRELKLRRAKLKRARDKVQAKSTLIVPITAKPAVVVPTSSAFATAKPKKNVALTKPPELTLAPQLKLSQPSIKPAAFKDINMLESSEGVGRNAVNNSNRAGSVIRKKKNRPLKSRRGGDDKGFPFGDTDIVGDVLPDNAINIRKHKKEHKVINEKGSEDPKRPRKQETESGNSGSKFDTLTTRYSINIYRRISPC